MVSIGWDGKLVLTDTNAYIYVVENIEDAIFNRIGTNTAYRTSWEVKNGLWAVYHGNTYCYNWEFETAQWRTHQAYYCYTWMLGSTGMGRPISGHYSNRYGTTKYWNGESESTLSTMRWTSNVYEWWNWYGGSTPLSVDIRIDHDNGQKVKEFNTIIDTQRIYNVKDSKQTLTVNFNSDLSVSCVATVKGGEDLPSGTKTYIDFPFATKDGEMTNKGKRLADSSNGKTIRKDWDFGASVDVTLPGGFALDVQLVAPSVQYTYSYEAVIVYDDGNMKQSKGLITCDVEIPDYKVEYVLL